ncbi:MAG: glycogen synthase, partial [Gemmataceae bacterium]
LDVPMGNGRIPAGVLESVLPGSDVPVYFIAEKQRFGDRPGIYGSNDDPYRYAFFSRAALDLAVAALGWRPNVVHAHDWHTAPAITWLATTGQHDPRYARLPTVFTIHNLMHQGTTGWPVFHHLGVLGQGLVEERKNEVNFMARGIYHATMISTVSPTYSQEIMTREGGFGLDSLLRHRHFDVHGILNGLDYAIWNPATDPDLATPFDAETLEKRKQNKKALQEYMALPVREDVPLIGMITRLDPQKGLDLMGPILDRLVNQQAGCDVQIMILGAGYPRYEQMLRNTANYHNQRMRAYIGYEPCLAQKIYGGCDVFLMPSLFEPCGLGQLIAMRYGAVPVVRATGGLADTVRHGVTGFTFHNYAVDDFWNALCEALYIWRKDPESWQSIQQKGMTSDFSWETSARTYQQLYEWAIARVRGY